MTLAEDQEIQLHPAYASISRNAVSKSVELTI